MCVCPGRVVLCVLVGWAQRNTGLTTGLGKLSLVRVRHEPTRRPPTWAARAALSAATPWLVPSGPALCGGGSRLVPGWHSASPTTARSKAEPAWHRRERAHRGQDRLLLRLLRAKQRLGEHHSAQQMPRGRGQHSGHNHVLAAIADAIHAHSAYKGNGKGGWDAGQWRAEYAGRNCSACGDYNFEHRAACRKCGTILPPPTTGKGSLTSNHANGAGGKAWGKGGGPGPKAGGGGQNYAAQGGGGGGGNGTGGGNGQELRPTASTTAAAATCAAAADENTEGHDPAERVKEIRAEEERIRKSKAQFADSNPRIVATLDSELATLASERERLQPLEVNLQAAAGRTAHARAHLAKIKEKREAAARALRKNGGAPRSGQGGRGRGGEVTGCGGGGNCQAGGGSVRARAGRDRFSAEGRGVQVQRRGGRNSTGGGL